MKIGDLARDVSTGDVVMVTEIKPRWVDQLGETHVWDFEVMYENTTYYVDLDELRELDESR